MLELRDSLPDDLAESLDEKKGSFQRRLGKALALLAPDPDLLGQVVVRLGEGMATSGKLAEGATATDLVLTVTQICHRAGFNSLSHFTTTFRRHVGMSPTQYRRMVDWQRDVGRYGPRTEAVLKQPRRHDF